MNQQLFKATGLNSSFHGGDSSFQDYIAHMQNVISAGRIDLNTSNAANILAANCPFEWHPEKPASNGVLLMHGLYDSPFTLQEIGKHFLAKGFLVRSILLPGHGTVPGDLLDVHNSEWLKAADYAIRSLQQQVSQIYLVGFSMGATLAIYQAFKNPIIKGLIVLAPALKAKRQTVRLLKWHKLISWFYKNADWYHKVPQISYVKYESFTCNAAYQLFLLMKKTALLIKEKSLDIPIFVVASQDDESVCSKPILEFFQQQPNPHNRMLFYTNDLTEYADSRIQLRKSAFPQDKILNFSHISLPISPANPYLGKNGIYHEVDFSNYSSAKTAGEIYKGALGTENPHHYMIQRLTYNPDFAEMIKQLNEFLENSGISHTA